MKGSEILNVIHMRRYGRPLRKADGDYTVEGDRPTTVKDEHGVPKDPNAPVGQVGTVYRGNLLPRGGVGPDDALNNQLSDATGLGNRKLSQAAALSDALHARGLVGPEAPAVAHAVKEKDDRMSDEAYRSFSEIEPGVPFPEDGRAFSVGVDPRVSGKPVYHGHDSEARAAGKPGVYSVESEHPINTIALDGADALFGRGWDDALNAQLESGQYFIHRFPGEAEARSLIDDMLRNGKMTVRQANAAYNAVLAEHNRQVPFNWVDEGVPYSEAPVQVNPWVNYTRGQHLMLPPVRDQIEQYRR